MGWPKDTTFHDSTLRSVTSDTESTIRMRCEDVFVRDANQTVDLLIEGVHDLTEDDRPRAKLVMEKPEGEILTFKEKDGWLDLIVNWIDYKTHTSEIKAYRFGYGNINFRVLPQESVRV